MLARICKLPFPALNPVLIFPTLGALNVSPLFSSPPIPEEYAMPSLFGVFFIVYVYFIISVVLQFAYHLDISVFTIPYPPRTQKSPSKNPAVVEHAANAGQEAVVKSPKIKPAPASPKAKPAPVSPKATRKPSPTSASTIETRHSKPAPKSPKAEARIVAPTKSPRVAVAPPKAKHAPTSPQGKRLISKMKFD